MVYEAQASVSRRHSRPARQSPTEFYGECKATPCLWWSKNRACYKSASSARYRTTSEGRFQHRPARRDVYRGRGGFAIEAGGARLHNNHGGDVDAPVLAAQAGLT